MWNLHPDFKLRHMWKVWAILPSLLMTNPTAASTVPVPALGGYHYYTDLYRSPSALATKLCSSNPIYTSSKIVNIPNSGTELNENHETVSIFCIGSVIQYGEVIKIESGMGNFAWKWSCPGRSAVNDARQPCRAPERKPRLNCDCDGTKVGNPIDVVSREKIQQETDIVGAQGPVFMREYSSRSRTNGALGFGWTNAYFKRIVGIDGVPYYLPEVYTWDPVLGFPNPISPDFAYFALRDGVIMFNTIGHGGDEWQTDSDVNYRLRTTRDADKKVTAWIVTTPSSAVETYDEKGRLQSIVYPGGVIETLTYSDLSTPVEQARYPGLLIQVGDNRGHGFSLSYDDKSHVVQVRYADGATVGYEYDTSDRLTFVTYPGGARRQYLYNEPTYQPFGADGFLFLTGIADELSPGTFTRYATFTYDSQGHPRSTEHNGVDKFVAGFNSYVDPLGVAHSFEVVEKNNVKVVVSEARPSGAGTGSTVYKRYSYDENNNITEVTDFDGTVTRKSYEPGRNLEILRTEAWSTAYSRTTSTRWHQALRLPVGIAEPKRLTTYTYDDKGNVLTRTEQATNDATGANGFGAIAAGSARSWAWTYSADGRPLTMTESRGGVNAVTTYAYDQAQNLSAVTNALGQQTTFGDYDGSGRVGRVTAPNGLVTTFTYHPRGWLESQTVGDETTRFYRDGAGQLTEVSLPDGTSLRYAYDAARRLTGISDIAGNAVHYTLDAAGNRIAEQVSDAAGNLVRNIARVFDVLGRIQQVTGAAQ